MGFFLLTTYIASLKLIHACFFHSVIVLQLQLLQALSEQSIMCLRNVASDVLRTRCKMGLKMQQ